MLKCAVLSLYYICIFPNAEFAVIEKMGLERIRRLNEDSELFIRLFRELGDGQK